MKVVYSESPYAVSYSSVIVNFVVSSIVSTLLSFLPGPEMTSSPFRPLDDVIESSKWQILKERTRLPISGLLSLFAYLAPFWRY